MKLNKFLKYFKQSGQDNNHLKNYEEVGFIAISALPELRNLFQKLSGAIFENGLFKVHNIGSFYYWTKVTFEYFKQYSGDSYCFAFDWVGRQYAVNYNNGKTIILLLDPATAEVFELDSNIESFLTEDLDEMKNGLLEFNKFNNLRKNLCESLLFEQCLGFKKTLFLGGKDEPDNFELNDMEVYWEFNYQIYSKIKKLPPGTLINLSIK